MPLQLDPTDPAAHDPKTAAAASYLRIDFLQLSRSVSGNVVVDAGEVKFGLYVDSAAAATKDPVTSRTRQLTPAQATALINQDVNTIYTQLSAPTGPFPNAVFVP